MQFVANGPDIPDSLLQAHEEGRVVFFCGAGISYPAGLPGFHELVKGIYEKIGDDFIGSEKTAYGNKQFDVTLDLLERRLPGQRIAMRKALQAVLSPDLNRPNATDTHKALVELSRDRKGSLRLVTTNFDRIFEHLGEKSSKLFTSYVAPMLPVPKNSRWNGLVYLHGLLPDDDDETALQRLVVTSGDFGLAYLTERWASRFVSELFRNYITCFVGYSIDDPVLRYMMDALAADRILGENAPHAYAFATFNPGKEVSEKNEWESKGVELILYNYSDDHSALHRTLKKWSEIYRDGFSGKVQIVLEYALTHPSKSTQEDDFTGRMLWALSDKTGIPAKHFAEFKPAPPIEWLDILAIKRFDQADLIRFDVQPCESAKKIDYSLMERPAPYDKVPMMSIVSHGNGNCEWDKIMDHIAWWLSRHLNSPKLVLWLAEQGGQLHERFVRKIRYQMNHLYELENDGKTEDLEKIREDSPDAIPSELMKRVWTLLLSGRVKSREHQQDPHWMEDCLERDGMTTALRLKLRELLEPKVVLRESYHRIKSDEPKYLFQIVNWEIVLEIGNSCYILNHMQKKTNWSESLPILINDFQQLLIDALDLHRELEGNENYSDGSYWQLPSIEPHEQNRGDRGWTLLIELLRDAWLKVLEKDKSHAVQIAKLWYALPYSTFKRLALFAASNNAVIPASQWVKWLTLSNSKLLWTFEVKRELLRLFVLQGHKVSQKSMKVLEGAILSGPPKGNEKDDDKWESSKNYYFWQYLTRLKKGGAQLSPVGLEKFEWITQKYPEWELADDERDEFSHWVSAGYEREKSLVPREGDKLVQWIKAHPQEDDAIGKDDWADVCSKMPEYCLAALHQLSLNGTWPVYYWRKALNAWSDKNIVRRSFASTSKMVLRMPDGVIEKLEHSLAWWLNAVSEVDDIDEAIIIDLCSLMLDKISYNSEDDELDEQDEQDPISQAYNRSSGLLARVLLNLCSRRKSADNEMIPDDFKHLFSKVSNVSKKYYRPGRVRFVVDLIYLFRVDRQWTTDHLIPLFNWDKDVNEALYAWTGFLWSSRLYLPLIIAIKYHLLSTVNHYNELGKMKNKYTSFLTYVALNKVDGFSLEEIRGVIKDLPKDGLENIAQTLLDAYEDAGEYKKEYWKNRIKPFWKETWPKNRDLNSPEIARPLALLTVSNDEIFLEAFSMFKEWFTGIYDCDDVISKLNELELGKIHPKETLDLLGRVVLVSDPHSFFSREGLREVLDSIAKVDPCLISDNRYQSLLEYINK